MAAISGVFIFIGKLTVTNSKGGAGIGSGSDHTCGDLIIHGGTITAKGVTYGTGMVPEYGVNNIARYSFFGKYIFKINNKLKLSVVK